MKRTIRIIAVTALLCCIFVFSGCTLITANPTGRWAFSAEDIYVDGEDFSHATDNDMTFRFEYVLFKDGTGQVEINGTPTYRLTYDYDEKGVTIHIDNTPIIANDEQIQKGGTHDNYLELDGDNYRLGAKIKSISEETQTDPESGKTETVKTIMTFTKSL